MRALRPTAWCCSVLAVLAALLLGACSMGGHNATGSSGDESALEQKAVGDSFQVKATDATDTSKTVTVQVTLTSCENEGAHLPEGYGMIDLSYLYDDDLKTYNKENGYWSVDDAGAISEGWCLVVAKLHYSNDSGSDCRVDLGNLRISHLDSDRNLVGANEGENWILGGIQTKEDYYRPRIAAHSQVECSVGFFIRTKSISKSNLLVMETASGNSSGAKVFSLGELGTREDVSSSK
ncbi:hypothetical protein Corgl_0382 [Coriobacterium glomerans PW2]|uniref:Lipoprotein n=2 Tax=Coriobacterium TaxID=33870 RepID=F2NAH4_CORGP|nr:hypothetical protein Corgl_0382 [Coriobacterium glomerans PW2]